MRVSWPDVVASEPPTVGSPDELPPVGDYLDRFRRVRVGPLVSVVFENRQTLWFRVQELARLARLTRSETVRDTLKWYEQLVPSAERLTAAIWVVQPGRRLSRESETIRRAIGLGTMTLVSDLGLRIPGRFLPQTNTDRLIGLAQWVEFPFTPSLVQALAEAKSSWQLVIESIGYCHRSDPLSDDVRTSLVEDLHRTG